MEKQLEDQLQGEFHLSASLFANVSSKVARVVDVSVWSRPVYSVEYVVCGESELHIESFADYGQWEILEERSVPIKLLTTTEYVTAQSTNVRAICIRREDSRTRATESRAVQLTTLTFVGSRRRWVSDYVDPSPITGDVENRATLPRHDVVELEPTDCEIERFRHSGAKATTSSEWQVVNIGECEAMSHIGIRVPPVKFRSRWIIGSAITCARATRTNPTRRVVDGVRPRIAGQNRQATREPLLKFRL